MLTTDMRIDPGRTCDSSMRGTHDGYGDDPTSFDQVPSAMSSAELVVIDGADHFYEGEYGEETVEDACDKIA